MDNVDLNIQMWRLVVWEILVLDTKHMIKKLIRGLWSATSAGVDDHAGVVLEYDVERVVKVEEGCWGHVVGHAGGGWHQGVAAQGVDHALQSSVVGRLQGLPTQSTCCLYEGYYLVVQYLDIYKSVERFQILLCYYLLNIHNTLNTVFHCNLLNCWVDEWLRCPPLYTNGRFQHISVTFYVWIRDRYFVIGL